MREVRAGSDNPRWGAHEILVGCTAIEIRYKQYVKHNKRIRGNRKQRGIVRVK